MTPAVVRALAGGGLVVVVLMGCGPSAEVPRTAPTQTATATVTLTETASPTETATATVTVTATPGGSATPSACVVPSPLRGRDVERLPVRDKVVALTFDAVANAAGVQPILEALGRGRRPRPSS